MPIQTFLIFVIIASPCILSLANFAPLATRSGKLRTPSTNLLPVYFAASFPPTPLSIAVENLDLASKIIKNAKNIESAKKALLEKKWKSSKTEKLIKLIEKKNIKSNYFLSKEQVTAILDLKLQKLTAWGIGEIKSEIENLSTSIIKYEKTLKTKKVLLNLIKLELDHIKTKFAVPRRTKIVDQVLNYNIEETIQNEAVVITITNKGYIKRASLGAVKIQKISLLTSCPKIFAEII